MPEEAGGMPESSRGAARRKLAAQVLRKTASDVLPEGAYHPVGNVRYVSLGADHSTKIASMVSWHESFHAFLNSSTTFGSVMIIAGLVADAGYPDFDALVYRMIDFAVETHEGYATVAALQAVSRSGIDPGLLAEYPDYQRYLSTFLELFDPARPIISTIALSSCARTAM